MANLKANMQSPLFRTLSVFGIILIVVLVIAFALHFADKIQSKSSIPFASREDWNAQPPISPPSRLRTRPPPYVIISHTATAFCYNKEDCSKNVQFIQNFHIESQGWNDIGYNFLVGGDGVIYEGRGWDVQGAHTFNYNAKSIGISFIGTFTNQEPTEPQIESVKKFIEHGVQNGKIAQNYKVLGHRQCIKTESPGERLYKIIKTWPHWASLRNKTDSGVSTTPVAPYMERSDSTAQLDNISVDTNILGVPYVTRRKWVAQPPLSPPNKLKILPPPYVIISHTATDFCYDRSECIRNIRFIQNFHIEAQGWDDIAYNFLVGGDGTIYEGRGWNVEGAHTFNYNVKSIGISFIGTFVNKEPTDKQVKAAEKLIEYGLQTGKLAKDYKLLGHRQCIKTESPGEKVYNIIKTWLHWSPVP